MIGGEAAIGVIYSGEMLYIQEEVENLGLDYNLEYVIPEEGTNVWIDSWDLDSLENCEVFQFLGDEVDTIYNNLWKEVKSN